MQDSLLDTVSVLYMFPLCPLCRAWCSRRTARSGQSQEAGWSRPTDAFLDALLTAWTTTWAGERSASRSLSHRDAHGVGDPSVCGAGQPLTLGAISNSRPWSLPGGALSAAQPCNHLFQPQLGDAPPGLSRDGLCCGTTWSARSPTMRWTTKTVDGSCYSFRLVARHGSTSDRDAVEGGGSAIAAVPHAMNMLLALLAGSRWNLVSSHTPSCDIETDPDIISVADSWTCATAEEEDDATENNAEEHEQAFSSDIEGMHLP